MGERVRPRRARVLGALLGLLVGVVVIIVVVAASVGAFKSTEIRDTQLEGTPTGRRLLESSDRILDCTDPKGECYQRSQRQTAEYVGNIGRANVLAVVCATDVDPSLPFKQRLAQVSACVADGLAAKP